MIGTERPSDYVIFDLGPKLSVLLRVWNTKNPMGRIFWAEQNVEKAVESPFPNETDVANRHSGISTAWTWLPKCMSVGRILSCKVVAKNVVVGHCGGAASKEWKTIPWVLVVLAASGYYTTTVLADSSCTHTLLGQSVFTAGFLLLQVPEFYLRLGLLPNENRTSTYSQFYMYKSKEALQYRMHRNPE